MWKPPERIKYKPISGAWPTASEAAKARLFSPIEHGNLSLLQRTWVPAMVPWRADDDGFVNDNVLDWYGRYARGKPGAIVVEATGIRDIPSGPLLRIGHERYIPGLKDLVHRVREESEGQTRLLIQVIDFLPIRRRPDRTKYLTRFLEINDHHRAALQQPDMPEQDLRGILLDMDDDQLAEVLNRTEWESMAYGYRERVSDTHLDSVAELPQVLPGLFSDAAERAKEAGFDGVELHYAHAYTMASFLSVTNTRTDGYGGSLENRLRLPLEVFAAVRERVGADYTVGCRFLAEECIGGEGGTQVDDSCHMGVAFAAAGMDFVSLSRGGKFDDAKQPKVGEAAYPYTGVSGYECMPQYLSDEQGPFLRNVNPVAEIRNAVRNAGFDTPIVVAGGIHHYLQAEAILENEQADIIGLARQALADPDWFEKVRLGYGDDVLLCEYTNYCEGLDQKHKQVTCQLWDRVDRDAADVTLCNKGKRRLVAPAWNPPGET